MTMGKNITAFLFIMLAWLLAKPVLSLSWREVIDRAFMVGIISLLVAAAFLILKTGFLSLFMNGFNKLGSFISPKSRAMEREDERAADNEKLKEFKGNLYGRILIGTFFFGLSSVTVSLLTLIVYY
jgi:hypothetical protein